MPTADELIDRLKDFRTRSAAKNALLERGEQAVGALIKALRSRRPSVRWAAVSILGELRAKEAIPELVEALRDDDVHSAAVEALQHITGEELTDDYDAWKRWLDMGGGGPETGPETPELEPVLDNDLVKEAVYGTDISAEEKGSGHVLRVPLGDRHQDVTLNFKA